jgi:demethylmenaquinone methyltransferase/2-methoxy-6-polyprenyl-1,4-benzoquinol methylase
MRAGATPAGVEPGDEAQAARAIRGMFGQIAPRYDLLNRLLSLRIDQYWRRYLVRKVGRYLAEPSTRWMDLCCGTGDLLLSLELERSRLLGPAATPGLGTDFCRPMLARAQSKLGRRKLSSVLVEADALEIPLPDESLDLITIAWGFRNLANFQKGLQEANRLLRTNGCLAILEFSRPKNRFWGPLFEFYFRRILPRLGNAISGSGHAYSYLQHSVREFLEPNQLATEMRSFGFRRVEVHSLTGGISVLHLGYK